MELKVGLIFKWCETEFKGLDVQPLGRVVAIHSNMVVVDFKAKTGDTEETLTVEWLNSVPGERWSTCFTVKDFVKVATEAPLIARTLYER